MEKKNRLKKYYISSLIFISLFGGIPTLSDYIVYNSSFHVKESKSNIKNTSFLYGKTGIYPKIHTVWDNDFRGEKTEEKLIKMYKEGLGEPYSSIKQSISKLYCSCNLFGKSEIRKGEESRNFFFKGYLSIEQILDSIEHGKMVSSYEKYVNKEDLDKQIFMDNLKKNLEWALENPDSLKQNTEILQEGFDPYNQLFWKKK